MPKPRTVTRPVGAPLVASSGFDDDATQAVPYEVAQNPPAVEPAPAVSMAPPMDIDAPQAVPPSPALASAADMYAVTQQLEAMREEIQRLAARNDELEREKSEIAEHALLARVNATANAPASLPPAAAPTKKYKLNYIGRRIEKEPYVHEVMDLNHDGVHVCGRLPEGPITFGATNDDSHPHHYVTRANGEWLIANDAPRDHRGFVAQRRYEWSREALAAFAAEAAVPVAV